MEYVPDTATSFINLKELVCSPSRGIGAKAYLPGLNCLLEARLEVPPPLYITRINTTGPECRVRTAYLFLPEFIQFLVTSTNLAEDKLYLSEQVRFCWK
jgi:hypothetical protein